MHSGKHQAILKHTVADAVYIWGQYYAHQIITLRKHIVAHLYLSAARSKFHAFHRLTLKKCSGPHLPDAGRQGYGSETCASSECIWTDGFHAFGNSHRTEILTLTKRAVTDRFHTGGNGQVNNRSLTERAVPDFCHTRRNLCTENAAFQKSAGADTGNAVFDNDLPDLVFVFSPRLFIGTAEIRHGAPAGDGQRSRLCQIPRKPPAQGSACNRCVGIRIIRRNIAARITGDVMAGVSHHFIFGYGPPPMNLPFVVARAHISLGNNHARIARLEHDHGMSVIVYPQNISDFYIRKCKLTRRVHPGRQTVECRIAEYKCKRHAAHGADILPVKRSALPAVISL